MKTESSHRVVITGIGLVTPLGKSPQEVTERIQAGDCAAAPPTGFDPGVFACPVCAQVREFEPQQYVSEAKMARLMNRDAQLAVAAARLALKDARVTSASTYRPEEIALFGATGLAGLPLREVVPLIKVSAGTDGQFDPPRFGQAGLKAVSPILSFKILSNMPFCFVSINENIQGANAIYTPWEGEGAQAVEAGILALQAGDARCVLVGGCDVKTHELAFATLQQQGVFDSWMEAARLHLPEASRPGAPASLPAIVRREKDAWMEEGDGADAAGKDAGAPAQAHPGVVPGEGAAFLVLETEQDALERNAPVYARLASFSLRPNRAAKNVVDTRTDVLKRLEVHNVETVVGSSNGTPAWDREESSILRSLGLSTEKIVHPKKHLGDLFAAAAPLQVAVGAVLAQRGAATVLANCFGHGCTQAAFVLERPEVYRQGGLRSPSQPWSGAGSYS